MTTDTLIEKVREELGSFDVPAEQVIVTTMRIMQSTKATPTPQPSDEGFVSDNLPLEEYLLLSRPERRKYQSDAEKSNLRWIEAQFNNLGANWIIVIDGHVVRHGVSLGDYPEEDDIRELQQKTGKCPFIFFSDFLLAIEESQASWRKTRHPTDHYPALPVTISSLHNSIAIDADLDIGAFECYGSLNLLADKGIITLGVFDIDQHSSHLGRSFSYFTKQVSFELTDVAGVNHKCRTTMICVDDWRHSPFVSINPARVLLVGRRVLLELKPRVILDFAARQTEVQSAKAGS